LLHLISGSCRASSAALLLQAPKSSRLQDLLPPAGNLGESAGVRARMSKRGWPKLRRAVWMAAVCSWHANSEIIIRYWARREEDRHSRVAAGAVAQPLLHTSHSAWALEQLHNPGCRSRSPGSVNQTISSAVKVQAYFLPWTVHGTSLFWLCLDRKSPLQ